MSKDELKDLIDLLVTMGLSIPHDMRARIKTGIAGCTVPAPSLVAAAVEKFSEDNKGLIAAASDREITAVRYLVAEFMSEPKKNAQEILMRGQSPGTKTEMAAMLGVSTQALWKYEKKYDEVLRMLRVDFAVATRLECIALTARD